MSITTNRTHGKSQETQGVQTRDVLAANRAVMALQLRTQKMKYDDIAVACGFAHAGAAHKAVQREMQRVVVTNVEELRREELNFLDDLQQKCYKKLLGKDGEAEKGMLWAVDRLIAISERRSKLMGLDVRPDETMGPQIIIEEVPMGYFAGAIVEVTP